LREAWKNAVDGNKTERMALAESGKRGGTVANKKDLRRNLIEKTRASKKIRRQKSEFYGKGRQAKMNGRGVNVR